MIVSVILAGGSGTRLWPLSREMYPKQLINIINEKTLLQETLIRLSGLEDMGNPIVVCNDNHRFMAQSGVRFGTGGARGLSDAFGRRNFKSAVVTENR